MVDPFGQQPREDARTGADLEDIDCISGRGQSSASLEGPDRSRLYSSATSPNDRLRIAVSRPGACSGI